VSKRAWRVHVWVLNDDAVVSGTGELCVRGCGGLVGIVGRPLRLRLDVSGGARCRRCEKRFEHVKFRYVCGAWLGEWYGARVREGRRGVPA
jgi:hypothetical protein